jgi:hypothetical protein
MVAAQSEGCSVTQVHVTLGDFFSLTPTTNHAFTIGAVASNCSGAFSLILFGEGDRVIKNTTKHFSKSASLVMPDKSLYEREAVFFNISVQDARLTKTWKLLHGGAVLYGPVVLPRKILEPDGEFKMAVLADMDLTKYSTETIARIKSWKVDEFDCFMHIGDFAYEIEDDGGAKGDAFFEDMSTVTKYIPYIVAAGNHENYQKGKLFHYRFRMPNSNPDMNALQQNHYYDFLVKDFYFITVNFDYVLYLQGGEYNKVLKWLSDRLELAKNNTEIRWKVFFTHRPIYCNDLDFTGDCSYNMYGLQAFQDILIRHNVNVVLNGHLHIYSRLKPFVNFQFKPMSTVGKGSYLQVITGHAGTEHFFPNTTTAWEYELPIAEKVDLTGPTYMQILLTPDTFEGQLRLSHNDSVIDTFVFNTTLAPKKYPSWIFYLLAALAVAFSLAVVAIMFGHIRSINKGENDGRYGYDEALVDPNKTQTVNFGNQNKSSMEKAVNIQKLITVDFQRENLLKYKGSTLGQPGLKSSTVTI